MDQPLPRNSIRLWRPYLARPGTHHRLERDGTRRGLRHAAFGLRFVIYARLSVFPSESRGDHGLLDEEVYL